MKNERELPIVFHLPAKAEANYPHATRFYRLVFCACIRLYPHRLCRGKFCVTPDVAAIGSQRLNGLQRFLPSGFRDRWQPQ